MSQTDTFLRPTMTLPSTNFESRLFTDGIP